MYLIDTNIISELRKERRASPPVLRWVDSTAPEEHHTSVLVIGEIRRGIERLRKRDPDQAAILEHWLMGMMGRYQGRILPVGSSIAEAWGRLGARQSIPDIDGLLAATAVFHDLTLVTADQVLLDIKGVRSINPFLTL